MAKMGIFQWVPGQGNEQSQSAIGKKAEPVGYRMLVVTQVLGGVFLLRGVMVGASDRTWKIQSRYSGEKAVS